jgi:hypothetical protein
MAAAAVPATFTTSFLTTIQTQKSSLTSWLSSEKSRIDVLTSDIEHAHSDETERIVAQLQRLDDVRTQRGLVAASNSENDAAVMGGVARQKRDLEEKKCSLEARVEAMRGKNTQGDMVLNGEYLLITQPYIECQLFESFQPFLLVVTVIYSQSY